MTELQWLQLPELSFTDTVAIAIICFLSGMLTRTIFDKIKTIRDILYSLVLGILLIIVALYGYFQITSPQTGG